MKLRSKILLNFSSVIIPIIAGALIFIYTLFSNYRENEFQQRQKEKITTTFNFLSKIKEIDENVIEEFDRLTINDLYDERLLIFNKEKTLIYSSIDNTPVPYSKSILKKLSPKNHWIELKEGDYDVVGICIENEGVIYYGISKAYDTFGNSKLVYLKYVLIFSFIGISLIIILVSFYLSKNITRPIEIITETINQYDYNSNFPPIEIKNTIQEITILSLRFNNLMKKMNEVFSFQKHAIHHISHELKTPIAILVSNFDRMEKETDIDTLKEQINHQKFDTNNLSDIINSLLEIAKAESENNVKKSSLRVDELLFDIIDELKKINSTFNFIVDYENIENEENLVIQANPQLLKAALLNLLNNCIQYSHDPLAKITLSNTPKQLIIKIENKGKFIKENEIQFLFQHFFRGSNAQGKRGFGLGLVFVNKIIALHEGNVNYKTDSIDKNIFTITLPLS